ncbi:MAG: hypothetical protein ACOX60_09065 [Massiliimalia sp.]|jgi:hypothetical protein
MNKTLKLSFSLRNTYRVNSILYSFKQVPLLKKIVPETLYQAKELKILANVISVIWELITTFLWKALYFATMVTGIGILYQKLPSEQVFLHILVCLTLIGGIGNTYLFNPTKDKYYGIILLGMDAREYALVTYGYALLKIIIGFFTFGTIFGLLRGVPLWICFIIPFFVVGVKITAAAFFLRNYEKTGEITNENKLGKWYWILTVLLFGVAYGLPVLGIALPVWVSVVFMVLCIISGIVFGRKVLSFAHYRPMYQKILFQSMKQMDQVKQTARNQSQKAISADLSITSNRKGFEYLNELFMKRHQKILWKASTRIAAVCAVLVAAILVLLCFIPEIKPAVNKVPLMYLPYFVFIMYAINRGTGFTQALFVNCDHSLLTYPFYKQPGCILKLFQIRLREIIKVNLLPAIVIGGGLALILYCSGGTDHPLHYVILLVSILCLSVFFSVHYLMLYYLLQPYNAGTELKSGTYRIAMIATYVVCYCFMQLKMSTVVFGIAAILFCVGYCIVASILVYRFAPKTFRIRA